MNARLFTYILVFQLLDVITTYLGVNAGATEVNPIIRMLLQYPLALIGLKLGFTMTAYYIIMWMPSRYRVKILLLYTIIMLYSLIVNSLNILF